MLWYVLAKYVFTLLGKSHLEGEVDREHEVVNESHVHLTHYELFGLKVNTNYSTNSNWISNLKYSNFL